MLFLPFYSTSVIRTEGRWSLTVVVGTQCQQPLITPPKSYFSFQPRTLALIPNISGQDPMLSWMGRLKEQVDIRYQTMGKMQKDANLAIDPGKSAIENRGTAADSAEDDQQVAILDLFRHEVWALQDAVFAILDQIIDCEQSSYLVEYQVGAGRFDHKFPWEICEAHLADIKTWVNEGDIQMAGRTTVMSSCLDDKENGNGIDGREDGGEIDESQSQGDSGNVTTMDQAAEELGAPKDEDFIVPSRLLDRLSRAGVKFESFDDLFKATHPGVKITNERRYDWWSDIFREQDPESPITLVPPTRARSSRMTFKAGVLSNRNDNRSVCGRVVVLPLTIYDPNSNNPVEGQDAPASNGTTGGGDDWNP
ncbi:hypothetical protein FSPOR_8212 [Fusarium sporotrichioides]|uniref:Uncharacterized protein n=1 Tax=Fusarium sporotrichioides TaxID=5514 RepID=A0A395RV45_FUSSP|nr:hypothetical protein FSPOR_8212 [Fusarium sporotrichioides]